MLTANGGQNHGAQYDADGDDEYVIGEVFDVLHVHGMVVWAVQVGFDTGGAVDEHGGGGTVDVVIIIGSVDASATAAAAGTAGDGHGPDGPEVVAQAAGGTGAASSSRGDHATTAGGRAQVIVRGAAVTVVIQVGRAHLQTAAGHATATVAAADDVTAAAAAIERYRVGHHPQHAAPTPAAGGRQCPEQGHDTPPGLWTVRRITIRRHHTSATIEKREWNTAVTRLQRPFYQSYSGFLVLSNYYNYCIKIDSSNSNRQP